MKRTLIIMLLTATMVTGQLLAQEQAATTTAKNAVYVELLGSAGYIYNLTYDRIVLQYGKHHLTTAIGLQFWPYFNNDDSWGAYSFSPQVNYLYGQKHFFELGIGIGYMNEFNSVRNDLATIGLIPRIGYRYQPNLGGLFLKAAFTPIIILKDRYWLQDAKIPWGGVAVGYSF